MRGFAPIGVGLCLLCGSSTIANADPPVADPEHSKWGTVEWEGEIGVSFSVAYQDHESVTGTDYDGLTRLRNRGEIGFDYRGPAGWRAYGRAYGFYDYAYLINGFGGYAGDVLDDYKWEADTEEVWVGGPIGQRVFVQIGRQVVNWGRSETLRVLDVLNPVDRREPGIEDLDELRRPIGLLRGEVELGEWVVEGLFIPEARVDRLPSWGNDFFPSSLPVPTSLLRASERRPDDFEDFEWGVRVARSFRGLDLSFHGARVSTNQPYFDPGVDRAAVVALGPLALNTYAAEILRTARFRYSRSWLAGLGGSWALGSWLLKGEVAYRGGLDFTASELLSGVDAGGDPLRFEVPLETVERDRWDGMVGVEFYGIPNSTIALDVVDRYIPRFEASMKPFFQRRHAQEAALRMRSTFLRQRLALTALGVYARRGGLDGGFLRFQADYELGSGFNARLGIALFQRGDLLPFDTIAKNDRIFGQLVYSF